MRSSVVSPPAIWTSSHPPTRNLHPQSHHNHQRLRNYPYPPLSLASTARSLPLSPKTALKSNALAIPASAHLHNVLPSSVAPTGTSTHTCTSPCASNPMAVTTSSTSRPSQLSRQICTNTDSLPRGQESGKPYW